MSNQGYTWEKEYKNPSFVTKNDGPQADTLRFLKFLKKEEKFKIENKNILDLGCGTGRNANYLADAGNNVIGIEISKTALNLAKERAKELNLDVDYRIDKNFLFVSWSIFSRLLYVKKIWTTRYRRWMI